MSFSSLQRLSQHSTSTPAARDTVAAVLLQLEIVLKDENAALESGGPVDYRRYMERKNHILRELLVMQRTVQGNLDIGPLSQTLKTLMSRNKSLLETNIAAIKEVSEAMRAAILDTETDGTYSPQEKFRDSYV